MQYVTRLTGALASVIGVPTPEQGNLLQLQARLLEQRAQQAPPALAARILKQVCLPPPPCNCVSLNQHQQASPIQGRHAWIV